MTPREFQTIRWRARLSQLQLGRLLGMSVPHISRMENGEKQIMHLTAAYMRLLNDEPDLARKILED